MPDSSIANWSVSTLTKFVKDVFTQDPVRFAAAMSVEDLTVINKLTVKDQVTF